MNENTHPRKEKSKVSEEETVVIALRPDAIESEVIQLPAGYFVEVDHERLPLDLSHLNPSDPTAAHQWIDVKRELNYAETQQLRSAGLKTIKRSGGLGVDANETEIGIDYGSFDLAKLEMWLVEWSLPGKNGRPQKCDRAAIDHLRPEVAHVILAVLDEYTEKLERSKKVMSTNSA